MNQGNRLKGIEKSGFCQSNVSAGRLGKFVTDGLQTRSILSGGKIVDYARGIFSTSYRGTLEVSHRGATGGYRAWLGLWPEKAVSLAILCNGPDPRMGKLPHQIADAVIFQSASPQASVDQSQLLEGLWVEQGRGVPLMIVRSNGGLSVEGAPMLAAAGGLSTRYGRVVAFSGQKLTIEGEGLPRTFIRSTPWTPSGAELSRFSGSYQSPDADATYEVRVDGNALTLQHHDRPGIRMTFKPVYKHAFQNQGNLIRFTVDPDGQMLLHMIDDRAWDVVFRRLKS